MTSQSWDFKVTFPGYVSLWHEAVHGFLCSSFLPRGRKITGGVTVNAWLSGPAFPNDLWLCCEIQVEALPALNGNSSLLWSGRLVGNKFLCQSIPLHAGAFFHSWIDSQKFLSAWTLTHLVLFSWVSVVQNRHFPPSLLGDLMRTVHPSSYSFTISEALISEIVLRMSWDIGKIWVSPLFTVLLDFLALYCHAFTIYHCIANHPQIQQLKTANSIISHRLWGSGIWTDLAGWFWLGLLPKVAVTVLGLQSPKTWPRLKDLLSSSFVPIGSQLQFLTSRASPLGCSWHEFPQEKSSMR